MTVAERGLRLRQGELAFPTFLPDATLGVVRSVSSADLIACGVSALVMNTFHLMQRPGSSTLQALGGLHEMCAWSKPIFTDSGGFQAYSLIHENPRYGKLSADGITFQPEGAPRKYKLTPEKTVQLQLAYGSDVVICLDDCTHVDAPFEEQERAVQRTIDWGRRGKSEFLHILEQKRVPPEERPLLFAVIQGGGFRELRRRCALELLEIGFDGYGYGGWPLDKEGALLLDIISYTRELIRPELPMHALGIGHPRNVQACFEAGYGLFDSALPTRDARRGRLYLFLTEPSPEREWFDQLYIGDAKHTKAREPICASCDCLCCTTYSLAYLHHLFEIKDTLFFRLATIHNLRFMCRLTDYLRVQGDGHQ